MAYTSAGAIVNALSAHAYSLRYLGKVCLVAIFILAPLNNLKLFEEKSREMVSLGFPEALAPYGLLGSVFLSLSGAALIVFSERRLGYACLIAFLLPVTFTMHLVPIFSSASSVKERESHVVHLLKNLAILGGLLLALAFSSQIAYLNHKLKEHQKEKSR